MLIDIPNLKKIPIKDKKISVLILCAFIPVTAFAQNKLYGEKFEFVGDTFITDDDIKRTEIIFIDNSKCIIKQKYYDPEIAKDYSIASEFRYKKEWTSERIKEADGTNTFYYYKLTLYPWKRKKGRNEPYIKVSDYALQRLNFSFSCPYTEDYLPNGERNCNRHIENLWDYTSKVENDGYIINPSSIHITKIYRINYQEYGTFDWLVFQDAPFESRTMSANIKKKEPDSTTWKCNLTGKTYVIADNHRMEKFTFINDSLCSYSQYIPIKGDTIEIKQSCKYKQDKYYLTIKSYSCTLVDSVISAMKNEVVCIHYDSKSCEATEEKYFPASYVYYVNVIDSDTLMISNDVLGYSKVFFFPDRHPIHFYRAYYPTIENVYRFDIPYRLFGPHGRYPYPLKMCHLNFGNAIVPIDK